MAFRSAAGRRGPSCSAKITMPFQACASTSMPTRVRQSARKGPVCAGTGAGEGTLSGRTVVDCSNPLDMATMQPHPDLLAGGPSAARQVAALAVGAHVVKGFNLAPAEV